jgi:predicted RND superfamily exporter protein
MKNIISILSHIFLLRPFLTLVALTVLIGLSVHQSFKLSINSNQIDLLPANGVEVVKTKEVIEMIGGNGFYIVAMKIKDEKGRDKKVLSAVDAKKKGNMELFASEMAEADKIKQDNLEYYTKNERKIKALCGQAYCRVVKR